MTKRYLDDFEAGQPSGPRASVSMPTASRPLPPNSIRNRFISTKEPPPTRYFEVSPRAAARPNRRVVKVSATTLNQNNQPVQVFVGNLLVLCRPTSSGEIHD
jgi:hypothetical protein